MASPSSCRRRRHHPLVIAKSLLACLVAWRFFLAWSWSNTAEQDYRSKTTLASLMQQPSRQYDDEKLQTHPSISPSADEPFNKLQSSSGNNSLIVWSNVSDWNHFMTRYWKTNTFCDQVDELQQRNRTTVGHFYFRFGCQELFDRGVLGTGNMITGFYGLQLAALSLKINATLECHDAVETKRDLVFPWLTGTFLVAAASSDDDDSSVAQQERWRHDDNPPVVVSSRRRACSTYNKCPIGNLLQDMRFALRRMAIALVGIPSQDHPAANWAEHHLWNKNPAMTTASNKNNFYQLQSPVKDSQPLFPNVDLDEAVIHFRCGDIADLGHDSYGFMKFADLTRHFLPNTQSIGIVTQSFGTHNQTSTAAAAAVSSQRRQDSRSSKPRERCRILVDSLAEYLTHQFPASRIQIRSDEPVALAYARIIMAHQAVAGLSSFAVFAVVSTFGTGYLRKPGSPAGPYQWVLLNRQQQQQLNDDDGDLVLFSAPNVLTAKVHKFLWATGRKDLVLSWFWNETLQLGTSEALKLLHSSI